MQLFCLNDLNDARNFSVSPSIMTPQLGVMKKVSQMLSPLLHFTIVTSLRFGCVIELGLGPRPRPAAKLVARLRTCHSKVNLELLLKIFSSRLKLTNLFLTKPSLFANKSTASLQYCNDAKQRWFGFLDYVSFFHKRGFFGING
jgi:hypothetical protein